MEKRAAKGREHNLPICRNELKLSVHDARGDGSFGWQVARLSAKEKALLLAVFFLYVFFTETCDLSSGISQLRNQLVICLLPHWEAGHMSTEAATLAAKHHNTFACILLMFKYLYYCGNVNGLYGQLQTKKVAFLWRCHFLTHMLQGGKNKDQKYQWAGKVKNKSLFISLWKKFTKEGLFYFD